MLNYATLSLTSCTSRLFSFLDLVVIQLHTVNFKNCSFDTQIFISYLCNISVILLWLLSGKPDDKTGYLKSIMAIYLFRKLVADLKKDGVDFSANLIVPEIDAATNEKLHQREDHNHLLKRIVGCIREGKIPGFNVIYLRDALHDPGRDNYDNSFSNFGHKCFKWLVNMATFYQFIIGYHSHSVPS